MKKEKFDEDICRSIAIDYWLYGMSYRSLSRQYALPYSALRPIVESREIKGVEFKRPKGSDKIATTMRELLPDLACMLAEGFISNYQFNQYTQQLKSKTT